jgi:transposase-like protein
MKTGNGKQSTKSLRYEDSFKQRVCREYLEEHFSICYLRRKYEIAGHETINRWLRTFGLTKGTISPDGKLIMAKFKKDDLPETVEQMKKRIRELERLLEDAELKVEINEKIIEIAEKQLNIQIRKKSGTK